jgi:hypothetical protein
MAGFKHTGLGAASAAADGVSLGQVQDQAYIWCGTMTGTADAGVLTPTPAITEYKAGQHFRWIASANSNTTAMTVAISGLLAIAVQSDGAALIADDHTADKMYEGFLDTTSTMQITRVRVSGTFVQNGTGAVPRTATAKMREVLSVFDFMTTTEIADVQAGTASVDVSGAIQAAIDAAAELDGGTGLTGSTGVGVFFPYGIYYLASGLTIPNTQDGVGLFSNPGKGAVLTTDQNIVMVMVGPDLSGGGDTTTSAPTYATHIKNLMFIDSVGTGTAVALQMNRCPDSRVSDCTFYGFDVAIDGHRFNASYVSQCTFYAGANRVTATPATAFIRMQGVYSSTEAHTPGGSVHITDCEFNGNSADAAGVSAAMLINTVDGLYITQCHYNFCKYSIYVNPLGTAANNIIADVYVENCYFDNPDVSGYNVFLGGTVDHGGVEGDGFYQHIKFVQCTFQGAALANYGLVVSVTDQGAFDSNGRELKNISLIGCTFRNHKITGVNVSGDLASKLEAKGVFISNCFFEDGSAAASTSSIAVDCHSVNINHNVFDADTVASTRNITINISNPTSDSTSFVLIGNDFARANSTAQTPYVYTSIGGAKGIIADNVFPVSALSVRETRTVTTSGYDGTLIWEHNFGSTNTVGVLNIQGVGHSTDTSDSYAALEWRAVYKRNNAGTVSIVISTKIRQSDNFTNNEVPIAPVLMTGPLWVTSTVYAAGDVVVNAEATVSAYLCITAGTSGATIPTHTSGAVFDGGVRWLYLGTEDVTKIAAVVSGDSGIAVQWATDIKFIATP